MAKEIYGLHESRTRVTFFLPATKAPEQKAILATLRYLEEQRKKQVAVTGFTLSQIKDPVFFGQWWDDDVKEWVPERNVFFIVDYDIPLDNSQLERSLGRLKGAISKRYGDYKRAQKVIWIIAQRVIRYA